MSTAIAMVGEYHKINSVFKRDQRGRLMHGDWSQPDFEYLADCQWTYTEKVDGTNVRIGWDGEHLSLGGRTDNAQMPTFLVAKLQDLFSPESLAAAFPDITRESPLTLYGEGYGRKIQKVGSLYNPSGVDFVLFDVRIGQWWLERPNVDDIASKLNIRAVPVIGYGTLHEAIDLARGGITSQWGEFEAEGLVARPKVKLRDRRGYRVIAKVKTKDFRETA